MKSLTLLVCLGAGVPLLAADAKPEIRVIEEIVAKVNGDIITRGDLDRGRKQLEDALRQRGLNAQPLKKSMEERSPDILREKIDDLLLIQKANQLTLNVDAEVSKFLADIQSKSKIADPDKFHDWLRDQVGQPFEDYKLEIKNGILKQRVVQQEISRGISISKAEAKKYYDEHMKDFIRQERIFLREIFISTENKDAKGVAAAEKKAKDLSTRARKGEKFPDLVKDNSEGASAQEGGMISEAGMEQGELAPKVAEAVWSQPRNYVSDPIRIEKGFLILKVEEHYKTGQAGFEEVENEITDRLYRPRFEPKVREYMTGLRREAFLEIRDGYTDTGAAPGKDTRWQDVAQLRPETTTKKEVASKIRKKRLLWMVPVGDITAPSQSRSQGGK